jgi:hypothetical protein
MTNIYLSPSWFYLYSIGFEIFFACVAFLVAMVAFRIFRLVSERNAKYFAWAFMFISFSYMVQSIFNFLILENLANRIHYALFLDSLGSYVHVLLKLVGLCFLVYVSLQAKVRALVLLMLVSLVSIAMSANYLHAYYVLSSIFLAFVGGHFVVTYLKRRDPKMLLIIAAFLFLFLGSAHYLIAVDHQLFYVLGHFLELGAYLLILLNFYLVYR